MIRVFGCRNGTEEPKRVLHVDQHGDAATARRALVDEAAQKLAVQPSVANEHVKMFLAGGVAVSGVGDLEKEEEKRRHERRRGEMARCG